MLWKIYFWILLAISILGLFGITQYEIAFGDFLAIILYVFVLIAIYSYSFIKSALSPGLWSILFVIFVVGASMDLIALAYPPLYDVILPFLKSNIETTASDYWFSLLLYLPGFYACYRLSSFAKRKK